MQTIFTIRVACDPADADKVSAIVDRAVDGLDEALCDPDRIDPDRRSDVTIARVTVARSGVTYVDEDASVAAAATLSPTALVDAANEAVALNSPDSVEQDKAYRRIGWSDEVARAARTLSVTDFESVFREHIRLNRLDIDPNRLDYAALVGFARTGLTPEDELDNHS